MAVLNVKNMPDNLYKRLRERAAREHRSIAQEVVHILELTLSEERPHRILDLRGLGKAEWQAVNATEHVAAERDSWD